MEDSKIGVPGEISSSTRLSFRNGTKNIIRARHLEPITLLNIHDFCTIGTQMMTLRVGVGVGGEAARGELMAEGLELPELRLPEHLHVIRGRVWI